MKRFKQRFENYVKALKTIEEVVPNYKNLSELEKDGLIKRFEFTFEMSWKVMQDYLIATGYTGLKGPRNVIKQLGNDGLLNAFDWQEILKTRNELTHIYDELLSRTEFDKIIFDYVPIFLKFKQEMQKIYDSQTE